MDLPEADSPVSQTVSPLVPRSWRCTDPECQTTCCSCWVGPVIMPAATVLLVASSTRMKLPVSRRAAVGVEQQRRLGAQPHAADLVQAEAGGGFVAVQGVDVQAVVELAHDRAGRAGGVLDRVAGARGQLGLAGHPAEHRVDVLPDVRAVVRAADQVAARDVDVVESSSTVTACPANASSTATPPGRQIALTVVVKPQGSTVTSSPRRITPPAMVPA